MSIQALSKSFRSFARFSDLFLVAGVLVVIALMVLRLPSSLVDALVGVNIAIGVGLLLIAIYIPVPVAFSSFPSVLLITTLFRLALSVATTRLILLDADAGHIIDAFGHLVAGGNLVVGIVVFIIITVVQFIVIAKGAERVAEVSARFTLDAMPGKQLSIDSDLRSGLISKDDAKAKRKTLERESQLNGALDGAMKFVKGDAIAGIIIVLVNLVGGFAIGMLQNGLSASEAMQVYSILTIGDGMVAQVPALLGTMAAGLVVTRTTGSAGDKHLADAIGKQIISQPRALMVTGVISLLLALVPGFPWLIFISLAVILITVAHFSDPSMIMSFVGFAKKSEAIEEPESNDLMEQSSLLSRPLTCEYGKGFQSLIMLPSYTREMDTICSKISDDLGVRIPLVYHRINTNLTDNTFRICIFDVTVYEHHAENMLVDDEASQLIADNLKQVVLQDCAKFLTIQSVSDSLDGITDAYPALVKETLRVVNNQAILEVFRNLVSEQIPIRNMQDILGALVEWGGRESDPFNLTEFARMGLKPYITQRFIDKDGSLAVISIDSALEDEVRKSLSVTSAGTLLTLDPTRSKQMVDQLTVMVNEFYSIPENAEKKLVMLTAIDLRRHFRSIVEASLPQLAVLSYQEVLKTTNIIPFKRLSLSNV